MVLAKVPVFCGVLLLVAATYVLAQARAKLPAVDPSKEHVAAIQRIKSKLEGGDIDNDSGECTNCVDDGPALNRWTMPLLKLGEKRYYLGIFFKANWYRAAQYCRYHGMHLASINSQEENDKLEKHIRDFGLGHEHFWTSGTDQAEEGTFFWMSTGRPVTFTNWNTGEPNNFRYENGEEEHCLELWNRDGKGLKWNDSPCSFETFFVCEVGQ
ncbi:C-type lectin 37Db isoform X2 [Macrosteles quadrilineatus]|uniref:C-type lectin 37Db isoform X2 n=1 Tax=Macrosteles quadrilineatus TaxID=74068 RepID=UPI0023E17639|nr:C-type lectin 37Db isoform X2 [Macrosteles quadrilineatus]